MSRFTRKENNKKLRKVIRIYTEGQKTEPNYFNSIKDELRLPEIDIKVHGCGDHTMPLVEWVIERKNNENTGEETEWWVVFDRDEHTEFNNAISLARSNSISVAYSNECFELWFILHFNLLSTAIGRGQYYKKLTELLDVKYEKNSSDIYELIKEKEATAILNAKNLEKTHNDEGVESPEKRDPSTLVYQLVEKLRALKADAQ